MGSNGLSTGGGGGRAGGGGGGAVRGGRGGLPQRPLPARARVSVGALRDLEQDRTSRPRRETVFRLRTALGLNLDKPGGRDRGAGAGDARGSAAGSADGAVRVCVLGPLEAWRGGGSAELGPARQRAVLGLL